LSQFTRLTDRHTDGRTDGQTDRRTDGRNSRRKTASAFQRGNKTKETSAYTIPHERPFILVSGKKNGWWGQSLLPEIMAHTDLVDLSLDIRSWRLSGNC